MRRVILIAAVCLVARASLADSDPKLLPVEGVAHANYNVATSQLTPDPASKRYGESIWDMTLDSGFYWGSMASDTIPIDWGDIADGALVDGFAFSYGTDQAAPTTIDCEIVFYSDYNGFNNNGWYALTGFYLPGLPTAVGGYNTWVITVDLGADPNHLGSVDNAFRITGNDLDDDGKADFGYGFWFPSLAGEDSVTGSLLADRDRVLYPDDPEHIGDPNHPYAPYSAIWEALGVEDSFDRYTYDQGDPNYLVYLGTSWFDPGPYDPNWFLAQFYLNLFGAKPCGGPGASGNYCYADIDGSGDCAVGLSDLSKLLSNYGASDATHEDGDVQGHDGDVDLADLATLLAQYGDNCGL